MLFRSYDSMLVLEKKKKSGYHTTLARRVSLESLVLCDRWRKEDFLRLSEVSMVSDSLSDQQVKKFLDQVLLRDGQWFEKISSSSPHLMLVQ